MGAIKILFLDIDGVLNSHAYWKKLIPLNILPDDKIDPEAVQRLNQITDATGAFIVVSSTWRMAYTHNFLGLRQMLENVGVTGRVLGMTPVDNQARGGQIQDWMTTSFRDIDAFVILDDDSDMLHLTKFLVKTNYADGLQDVHVQKAIAILNGDKT